MLGLAVEKLVGHGAGSERGAARTRGRAWRPESVCGDTGKTAFSHYIDLVKVTAAP